jgi:hypothetical protein
MKTENLSIDLLKFHGETQSRIKIDQDVVEDYAEIIRVSGEWPFPPLDVFTDGSEYWPADGFHRGLGAVQAKRASVPCNIHAGTARDARIFGMTANDKHGLRMTRADKRSCVEWLLDNGGKMTQAEIAEKAGVSTRWVRQIVADRNAESIKGKLANKAKPKPPNATGSCSSNTPDRGGKPGTEPSQTEGYMNVIRGTDQDDPLDFPDGPEPDHEPTDDEIREANGEKPDRGKCPNCAGEKWTEDEDGVSCAKCKHPHGEPTGGADEERIKTQRSKTIKTVEALQRAFDDLHLLLPKPQHDEAVKTCKVLLRMARAWK